MTNYARTTHHTFKFDPREDITTLELAQILALFMPELYVYEEEMELIPKPLLRHLRLVKSEEVYAPVVRGTAVDGQEQANGQSN